MTHSSPKFGRFVTWGACSRCGARVNIKTLARERLTGLLVCTASSGRPVRFCLDPWPQVYDFQVTPDRSIEPPPEPLPTRWMLDNIFSAGTYNSVAAGTPAAYANAPKAAPSDEVRLQSYLIPPPNTYTVGNASFTGYENLINQNQDRATVVHINPANYDGTFVPSNSVRTVTPPSEAQELADLEADAGWTPPWAVEEGI
jgi:hypothetical protein